MHAILKHNLEVPQSKYLPYCYNLRCFLKRLRSKASIFPYTTQIHYFLNCVFYNQWPSFILGRRHMIHINHSIATYRENNRDFWLSYYTGAAHTHALPFSHIEIWTITESINIFQYGQDRIWTTVWIIQQHPQVKLLLQFLQQNLGQKQRKWKETTSQVAHCITVTCCGQCIL